MLTAVKSRFRKWACLLAVLGLVVVDQSPAQTVQVGAGSYTTALPTGAAAPQSTVYKTYAGPVATHKWWTAKNWNPNDFVNGGPYVMYPDPLNVQAAPTGLVIGNGPAASSQGYWFFRAPQSDLTLGVAGINAQTVNVSAYTDWTADFNFGPMTTRIGKGMPFVYALMNGGNPTVTFATVPTIFANNGNILGVTIASNNYGLFCPTGGTWSGIGSTTLTCNLPLNHAYFSLAILPSQAALSDFAQYAFSFPTNTQVSWSYNQAASQVSTTYTVTTQAMEGSQTGFLMALFPHQYGSSPTPVNTSYTFNSARGVLEVNRGNTFTTVDTYHGVLPYLPPTGNYNTATLQTYLDNVTNEGAHFGGGDTYNVGLENARIAHLLPIANALGTPAAKADLNTLLGSVESNISTWFTATPGKSNQLFYYDNNWNTLIGYPAGYGSDTSLNDHHFHYGYWIHSAALIGLYDPNWLASSNWGGMVNMLAKDIANPVRGDSTFPFMRHFDVYAGHSWAAGAAPFLDGGNEESSSEAVNAWTGLILYAQETNNIPLRDAAIWLYTQETKSVQYYWFNNGPVNTFPAGFTRKEVANVFDDKSDTGTWFASAIEFEHGIEFLPFTGGSAYLGRDTAYNQANWAEILQFQGVSTFNPATANWPDLMEEYQAFFDPTSAINNWNNNPANSTFNGETQAHEYYWLHNMQALGNVDYAVTANTPLYSVYKNPSTNVVTHIAYNTTSSPISVAFSDGASFTVPANAMQTDSGTVTVTIPTAPSGLNATATSSSQINLSWTASSTNGVTYAIYSSTTPGFTAATANMIANVSATSFSNTGLAPSSTHYYLVQAVNSAGNSVSSNQATATTQAQVTVPAAPSGLVATAASTSQINLSWAASSTSGVTYTVYGSTTAGFTPGAANQIASGLTALSYSNTGLAASSTHYYLVQAVNSAGNSASSNQATATTQAQITIPNAPSGLVATAASTSQINLSWAASSTSGVTYTVYGSTTAGFTASSANQIASGLTALSYANTGLAAGTTHYYLVQAVNSAGNSASSNQATASTQVAIPNAPSGLVATAASSSQINLSWAASSTSGVTYTVYGSTTAGFTASSANQLASGLTALSYANTGLAASSTHYYLVLAVNSAGNSASSNQATATTQPVTVTSSIYISAGGPAAGNFVADVDFSGGTVAAVSTATIDTSLLPAPVPPQSVLQHERYGPMTYTIGGLTPGKGYTVALIFAELYWSAAGQRQFNVAINGTQVLTNFDILANAGAKNKALGEFFSATANASGQVVIQFTTGAADLPKIDGIEVF